MEKSKFETNFLSKIYNMKKDEKLIANMYNHISKMYYDNIKLNNDLEYQILKEKEIIHKKSTIEFNDYIKVESEKSKSIPKSKTNNINVDFYIDYINNNSDYLELLPKDLSKDSLLIFYKLLCYYLEYINYYKSIVTIIKSKVELEEVKKELVRYEMIYYNILNYKKSLNDTSIINEVSILKTNVIPLFEIVKNNKEIYNSIYKLIESIINGTFKNIFSLKGYNGILEVRDISNETRVIFKRIGKNKYLILSALINKCESNSIYKNTLNNIVKLADKDYSEENVDKVLKLLKGDNND